MGRGCQAGGGCDGCSQAGAEDGNLLWPARTWFGLRALQLCSFWVTLLCHSTQLAAPNHALRQELEAQEARLQRRTEELSAVERRIAAAQQRLDGETERLKRAVAAVEEEGAALKVRCKEWGRSCSSRVADYCPAWLTSRHHFAASTSCISPVCLFCDMQEREQELAAREDQLEVWKAQFKAEAVRQVGLAAAAAAASRIACHLSTV